MLRSAKGLLNGALATGAGRRGGSPAPPSPLPTLTPSTREPAQAQPDNTGSGRPSACLRREEGGERLGRRSWASPLPFSLHLHPEAAKRGTGPPLPTLPPQHLPSGPGLPCLLGEPGLCSISCHLIPKSARENGNKSAPTAQTSCPISDVSPAAPSSL